MDSLCSGKMIKLSQKLTKFQDAQGKIDSREI